MKVKVKDYKILLWLSKLGQTVSEISHQLTESRDEIAERHGLTKYLTTPPTEEEISDPNSQYHTASQAFTQDVQAELFEHTYDLAPLGPLTLTEEVITSAELTPEDMIKLERTGLVVIPKE